MPSTYAHYRLGKLLVPALPPHVQQCVGRFRRMYDMGLQGPDIFFYHNPFVKTAAGELGNHFHDQSGQVFFTRACKAASTEAGRAYLYGLLAHYCLDAACHPFIEQKVKAGEGEHIPMEKEFERYLMTMDGLQDPHAQDLGGKIRLTRGECVTVAAFYPPATPGEVNGSVKFMAIALSFLAKNRSGLIYSGVRKFYPDLLKHAIPEAGDAQMQQLCSQLLARFNHCQKDYLSLLAQLEAHMQTGEALGEDFLPAFN